MLAPTLSSPQQPRGFSLVELLLVLAVVSALMVMSVGSVQNILQSTSLTSSAAITTGVLNYARQRAQSSNRPVEVRFYKLPPRNETADAATSVAYRAIGLYEIGGSGPQMLQKLTYLNDNTEFATSETFGTLLYYTTATTGQLTAAGAQGTYEYRAFQFSPDGSTNLDLQPGSGDDSWHVMIYSSKKPPVGTTPPANYISVQLDPLSGRTESFQPGM